jgi:hypothetical protein
MTDYPQPHAGIDGTPRTGALLSLDDGDIERVRRAVVGRVSSMSFWDRCAPSRPGEFAIEETVLLGWAGGNWYRGVGILLARRRERPCDAAPRTEEAWYIQYGPHPDDVCRWANSSFTTVPAEIIQDYAPVPCQ